MRSPNRCTCFITLAAVLAFVATLFVCNPSMAETYGLKTRTMTLCSGVSTAGVAGESGASIFVIDVSRMQDYGGDVMIQLAGVTPDSRVLATTGLSIYYANGAITSDATNWVWKLASWTSIQNNILMNGGTTVYAFDVAANPAAPYVGIKVIGGPYTGTSPFLLNLKATVR